MANFYEHNYQSPYNSNQVTNNLYDHSHYHQHQYQYQYQQQDIAYDPQYQPQEVAYDPQYQPQEIAYDLQYQQEDIAYDPQYQQQEITYDPTSYNNNNNNYYNWNGYESEEPSSYYNWNGYETNHETNSASVAYSVSTISESKHLFYDPNHYTTYSSPPQFNIYCSVQGLGSVEGLGAFNEPEFDEYDPTPYGGGYDIVATYGKPLPQSVVTCYPSLTAGQSKPPTPPEIITPVPLGIYDGGQKNLVKKRVTFSEPLEAKPFQPPIKEQEQEQEQEDESESESESESDSEEEEEEEEEDDNNVVRGEVKEDDHSLSYGNGEGGNDIEKGEVKALYVPSGYGLEATDLCEVIFGGYFPCVLRNKKRQEDENLAVTCWESNDTDPWKTTSDYIFGDSYPYGNENRTERNQFEISSYGYRS